MFTGIIQHQGIVEHISPTPAGVRLVIAGDSWEHAPEHGDSIAVNGCCLTVARDGVGPEGEAADDHLRFDVIHQTLGMTALGDLKISQRVNLEHAVTPATLLGGHLVQGHVDGVGRVADVIDQHGEYRVRITPSKALMEYIETQGSITIDGVSLTIATRCDDSFEIALIPATLELTTLGERIVGDRVNVECDYIARMVIGWLERRDRRLAEISGDGR